MNGLKQHVWGIRLHIYKYITVTGQQTSYLVTFGINCSVRKQGFFWVMGCYKPQQLTSKHIYIYKQFDPAMTIWVGR